MPNRRLLTIVLVFMSPFAAALELADYRLVDLSHEYSENTLYWPTSPSAFEKQTLAYGDEDTGYFYSAFAVCTPEHGGTHIDAPLHFAANGRATSDIPLGNLLAPAFVIDVSASANEDRNYQVTAADVAAFEDRYGRIPAGAIVLARTDWSRFWPDALAYLGDDTPGDASKLQFPGFGADAVRVLAEDRGVVMIGIDTASIDFGKSQDFMAHRVGAAQNVANLENLTNLAELPATGSYLVALPMKIAGGSGGPVRVVALVPR